MNVGAPTPRAAARGRAENISMHIYNIPAPLPPSHTARGLAENISMPNLDHTIKTRAKYIHIYKYIR
jgi:hypothetical protein